MTDLDTDLRFSGFPPMEDDNDEDHFWCCKNKSISICGKDLTNVPEVEYQEDKMCQTCEGNFCAGKCPLGLVCPD